MNHKKLYQWRSPNIFQIYENKKLNASQSLRPHGSKSLAKQGSERNENFYFELNNIAPLGRNFYKHHSFATKK